MQLIESFKQFLLSQKNPASAVTVKNYLADIRKFVLWFEQHFSKPFAPQEVNLEAINAFKASISQGEGSEKSIERYGSSLRKFFYFLKLEGLVASNPFEAVKQTIVDDPLHLKSFKNFLYVYNASTLTIKNYLIDIKQFFSWAQTVCDDAASMEEILKLISPMLLEEYRQRLLEEHVYSPTSINRKLSSLRKYFAWAIEQGIVTRNPFEVAHSEKPQINIEAALATDISGRILEKEPEREENGEKVYSAIPPIRLVQKSLSALDFLIEKIIVTPVVEVLNRAHTLSWHVQGKPIFTNSSIGNPLQAAKKTVRNISNFPKAFYAPLKVSIADYPWYKKVIFHIRFTRPQWYKKYHSYAISHYFNLAVLVIFCVIIGTALYTAFVNGGRKNPTFASAPVSPLRILSFQGRLTDNSDNPITTLRNLRFTIYSDSTGTGSARLWEEEDSVTPDTDGIFSVLLGSNGSGGNAALCNGGNPPTSPPTGACGIPQSLFAQNAQLWLGVTVESGAELTPRQQLATVAYATNAETLQGLPPTTDSAWISAGLNENAVLALSSNGVVNIAGSGHVTTIQASSSNMKITGNVTTIASNVGSNGNVELIPDGSGLVDVQKPLFNSTLNSNLRAASDNASTSAGAVEVDDLFAVLATSSGQSAVTINQDGVGPIISASHSGSPVFTVSAFGDTTIAGNTNISGNLTLNNSISGNVSSNIVPTQNIQYDLGSSTLSWRNVYALNIISPSSGGIAGFWQLNNGALAPTNITNDLLLGSTATTSATFGFINVAQGTPTATISAGTAGALYLTATGRLATTAKQDLVLGDSTTTGNIQFFSQSNTLTSGGNLTLGGTISIPNANTITGVSNFTNFSQGVGFGATSTTPTYYVTNGGVANFSNVFLPVTGGVGGFFQLGNNVIAPANTANDFAVGGNSTASATFQIFSNGNATSEGTLTFNTVGSIQTTNMQNITIGGANTGNIALTPLGGTNGLVTINGNLALSTFAQQGGVVYQAGANGQLDVTQGGLINAGKCLVSGGAGTPTWQTCSTGSIAGVNYWQLLNGTLSPINSTLDFLVGGTATNSAHFAVLNVNTNTTVASVSAQNGAGNALSFDTTAGSVQTQNNQTLTIGGNTTGNIVLSPLGGTGTLQVNANTIALGGTNTVISNTGTNTLTLNSGSTGNLQFFNANNYITSGGTLQLQGSIFLPVTGGTDGYWQLASNVISPSNTINDLVVGGNSTASAKFHVYGATGNTTIGTSNAPLATLDVEGTSSTTPVASISGNTSGSALVADQIGSGNIFSANQAGATRFAIATDGSLTSSKYITAGGVLYTDGTGLVKQTVSGTSSQCLLGGTNPGWQQCALGVNWLTMTNGALYPINSSLDFLIGGTSTNSAIFAVTGATSTGASSYPSASVSAQTGNFAGDGITLGANGSIQALQNNNLTIGGNTTGNITLSPLNGGTGSTVTVNALSTLLNGTLAVNQSGAAATKTNIDSSGNVLPGTDLGGANLGALNTRWTGLYVGNVTANNVLLPVTGGIGGFWQLANNVIAPSNLANDLAIGGNSTGSATPFQVFAGTVNTEPAGTASTSGNLSLRGTTSKVNILNGATLGFYTSAGGDSGLSANPSLFLAQGGNIGIGTTTPLATLDVVGSASLSGNLTLRGNGTAHTANILDNGSYGFYTSLGGNAGITTNPTLFISNANNGTTTNALGSVGIGTSTPLVASGLDIEKNSLSNATLVVNQLGSGDIFTASSAGATKFTLGNDGTITTNKYTTNGGVLYTNGSGVVQQTLSGTNAQCLTGGTTLTWQQCALGVNWWTMNNGSLYPINSTLDFFVGGTSTNSAIFAVTGATSTGASSYPSASVSAQTGNFAGDGITLGANGSIQALQNNNLTIGGNTTGNITLSPLNGGTGSTVTVNANTIALGGTNTVISNTGSNTLTLNSGSTGNIQFFSSSNTLSSGGNLTLAGNINLPNSNTITGITNFVNVSNGVGFGATTGAPTYYITAGGVANLSNVFLPVTGGVGGFWQLGNNVLAPTNPSNDLAIGGNATGSATPFQVFALGTNAGTATTSGNLSFRGASSKVNLLNGGNLGFYTSNGGDTGTGNPSLFIANAANGTAGSIGINTNSPTAPLDVNGAASISGALTFHTGAGSIQTTTSSPLTIGGATTGPITLSGLNGSPTGITFSGYGAGIIHSSATGNLSSAAVNLGTSDVTGVLPLSNGGTSANLTGNAGGIVYSTSSQFAILAGTATAGQCLISGSSTAPSWATCATGANGTNYWTNQTGVLYPINTTYDLVVGGTSTASAKFAVLNLNPNNGNTPVASISAQNGAGQALALGSDGTIQTVRMQNLTIGGNTTGNITLAPLSGTANGSVTINGGILNTNSSTFNLLTNATTLGIAGSSGTTTINNSVSVGGASLDSTQSTFNLLATPTTVNIGNGATTALNIGSSSNTIPLNLKGNTTVGNTPLGTNTVTFNAEVNSDFIPKTDGAYNLGAPTLRWNNIYAMNISIPAGNGTSGFWTITNNTNLYPSNAADDLLIGGSGTGSATFQIYASSFKNDSTLNSGTNLAGTASTSGSLTFTGKPTQIALLNGTGLNIASSVGGDAGLSSLLNIANNGNITYGGTTIDSSNLQLNLFNSPTTITFGESATSLTIGANNSGFTEVRNEFRADQNYRLSGGSLTDIKPNSTTLNLGSTTTPWSTLFVNNVSVPVNSVDGYWKMQSGVLSPQYQISDLAIGGTATGSATPFQVFANAYTNDAGTVPAGTASTSGNLVFRGATSKVNILNGATLGFYTSLGGNKGLNTNPGLFIENNGTSANSRIGINTTTVGTYPSISTAALELADADGSNSDIAQRVAGGSYGVHYFLSSQGTLSSPTSSQNGNTLGELSFMGYGSGDYFTGARILAKADGNFTSNSTAGYLSFRTTAPGSTSDAESMRISSQGGVGIGTSLIGNGTLVLNQQNVFGLGDIFSASTSGVPLFTIANDGTIKNSLIPNLNNTYNLGSDPTLPGGKEWDTLYVRQIVTPANGGIAGFWQLSSDGVLAPSNTSNSLVVGGNSTASAHFEVFGSGPGVGTISAILNNPQVNNNSGLYPSQQNIISFASPNHTYLNISNQDLTLGGHKNFMTGLSGTIMKVFYYDTSKDVDGGRWTNDERAQSSSWYNESRTPAASCTIGTNTRCGSQAFPRKAILVVTTTHLYIFDAKDNSLWMDFAKGSGATEQMIGPTTNSTGNAVTALNGKIYFGNMSTGGTTVAGLYVIDFIHDNSYKYYSDGYYTGNQSILNRNSTTTYTANPNIAIYLPSARIYDLSANIINGQTYLAVGTRGQGNATAPNVNGSVDLINESTLKQVATYGSVLTIGAIANNVWLTSTGDLYTMICQDSNNPCTNSVLKVKHNAQNGSGVMQLFDEVYGAVGSSVGVTTTDKAQTTTITFSSGPTATTAANLQPTGLYVTPGTSTVDGISNTIYIGEAGSSGSVAVIQENQSNPLAGSVKFYNGSDISEDMVGDTRVMLPMAGSGTLATNTTLTAPDADVSVKGVSFTTKTATVTHSSAVRGTGLTFNGTSDYLCTGTSGTCANNASVDFGNNNISISFWMKSTVANKILVEKQATSSTDTGFLIQMNAGGQLFTRFTDGSHPISNTSVRTINDGNWHHVAVVLSRTQDNTICSVSNPCISKVYIDGQLDGQTGANTSQTSISTTAFMTIGASSFATPTQFFNGTLDELTITETALTNAEIAHMYQVGYRALQNHTAKTIRGVTTGADANQAFITSDSNVQAVSANMQNGNIYVGTTGGLSVIGMDTDTINDAYTNNSTSTGDTGTAWNSSSNNNFITSIATGQSYGNGTALFIANSTAANVWMETQDTSLKDMLAESYNPFGANLTQTNLYVDGMFRVTNQLSTRLDNLALNATSSAAIDLFQVDSTGNVFNRSMVNNANSFQIQDANANTLFNINSLADANAAFTLNTVGSGDIITASTSGQTRFKLDNSGNAYASKFIDIDNPSSNYFLDPANAGNSLLVQGNIGINNLNPLAKLDVGGNASVSGNLSLTGSTANPAVDILNGKTLGFYTSVGGTALSTPSLFVASGTTSSPGNIGIGTTSPMARLDVGGTGGIVSTGGQNLDPAQGFDLTPLKNSGKLLVGWNRNAGGGEIDLISNRAAGANGGFNFYDYTNAGVLSSALFTILGSGNVGIGTTNPGASLDLSSTGTIQGAGLSDCVDTATTKQVKLLWSASTKQFSCGSDRGSYFAQLASTQNTIVTTLANVTGVDIPSIGANENWVFFFNVGLGTSSNNSGYKINITSPTSPTSCQYSTQNSDLQGAAQNHSDAADSCNANVTGVNWAAETTNDSNFLLNGYLDNGANSGNLQLQIAETAASGTVHATAGVTFVQGYRADGADVAEIYFTNDSSVKAGDVVAIDPTITAGVKKTTVPYQKDTIGVISTKPGQILAATDGIGIPTPLALTGRVPVKVTTENGPIQEGDFLTSSSIPGFAMRARHGGQMIGKAMTSLDPSVMSQCATKPQFKCGEVLMFINNSYIPYNPNPEITDAGTMEPVDASPSADFTVPHYYTLTDALGNPVEDVVSFAQSAIGNLKVGSGQFGQIITNSLAVATGNVSIAGQSLHDYIASVVREIVGNNNSLISPTTQTSQNGTIAADVINPLATGSAVTVKGKLVVASDSEATSSSRENVLLDVQGSASIAGTLNSSQLAVNGDATVSGTLHADKIEANSIVGLSAILSTLSAQNITNVTNITFATPPANTQNATGENTSQTTSSSNSGLLTLGSSGQAVGNSSSAYPLLPNGYTNIASYSGFLSYVPQLHAATAQFDQGLIALGPTSLSDTSITGTLSIGANTIFADNTLNVLGQDLEIQPLRQGGVDFLAGAVKISSDGDLTVNGKAVFTGGVYASIISPLARTDLNVILGSGATPESDSKFNIKNSSGSAVLTVNSVGDLIASGAATISKLNLNPIQQAQAVSETEIIATSSAGQAVVNAYQKEITIDTPFVTEKSLIYITPIGDSHYGASQTPFLLRQDPGKSFTVGVNVPTSIDTKFNWLIIN